MKGIVSSVSCVVLLNLAIACAPTPTGNDATSQISPSPRISETTAQPPTKTVTDPWTQKPIPVNLYNQAGIPFTTYVPANEFVVDSSSADEGTGVWFYSQLPGGKKQEQAYVHVFFPTQLRTIDQMRQTLTGEKGLLKSNGWQVDQRTTQTAWTWAKERIDFQGKGSDQPVMGTVYLGEQHGKVFRVTVHYPADYGDGFAPRAQMIVENLQVVN